MRGLKTIKSWFPAYLWFSGVLCQCLFVLFGLQALLSLIERRPAHALERKIAEQLINTEQCTNLLAGQEFSWLEPRPISVPVRARNAELINLVYRNSGSLAMAADGTHTYRVWFETDIKDLKSGETIRFPARVDQYLEVGRDNKIVRCTTGSLVASPNLQELKTMPCEQAGWHRRMLCDRGTERCYPLAQCEQGS